MKTNGYIIRYLTIPRDLDKNSQEIDDSSDRLQLVFFVNPYSLEYIKFYYKVVILDTTYNTNSQDIPLLEFIGVKATGKSFCIIFTLLPGEREEDYQAAIQQFRDIIKEAEVPFLGVFITDKSEAEINAIKQIFPNATHILCLQHANQLVQGECQQYFVSDYNNIEWNEFYNGWKRIVYSLSLEKYETATKAFCQQWCLFYSKPLSYLERNQFCLEQKEQIIGPQVNKVLYLQNTTTSQGEGIHRYLKDKLRDKMNLLKYQSSIDRFLWKQYNDID